MRSALFVGGFVVLCACGTVPIAESDTDIVARGDASAAPGPLGASSPINSSELCGDGLDNDGNGKVDEGCPCAPGATQRCFVGSPDDAKKNLCAWGTQTCTASGSEVTATTSWGDCVGSGVTQSADAGECKMACDGLPESLGGYHIVFKGDAWTVMLDNTGRPVKADGTADAAHTCTVHAQKVESGSQSIAVPAGVSEVFFQLVGAGGGGGRFYNPSSSGGGAGAFVAGVATISGATSLALKIGEGGGTTSPTCSEDACNFKCTCPRGAGTMGGDTTLVVNGATITAGGGGGGTQGNTPTAGGKFGVHGAAASIHLDTMRSSEGALGGPGCGQGCSGKGASPTCDWGTGAANNQSGTGAGAGGGGGNNSPAGSGSDGVGVVQWVECL